MIAVRATARRGRSSPTLRLFMVLVVGGFCAPDANAAKTKGGIYVDGSGSMLGYHASGALDEMVHKYVRALNDAGLDTETKTFVSRRHEQTSFSDYSAWTSSPRWGAETDLVAPLDHAGGASDVIVLITDNVHDPDASGAGAVSAQDAFVARLRGWDNPASWLVLHLLPFDGPVYIAKGLSLDDSVGAPTSASQVKDALLDANEGRGEVGRVREQRTSWAVEFTGSRGLAAYVFATTEAGVSSARKLTAGIADGKTSSLLLKPMDPDVLQVAAARSFSPSAMALECSRTGSARALESANLELESKDGVLKLLPRVGVQFDPSKERSLVANLSYKSTLQHIQIGELGGAGCDSVARASVEDVRIQTKPGLAGILTPPEARGYLSPDVIVGDPSSASGDATTQLVLSVPPLVGAGVPCEHKSGAVRLVANLAVQVPGQAFQLSQFAWDTYFTRNPAELRRLYTPVDPVRMLSPDSVRLEVPIEAVSSLFDCPAESKEPPWNWFYALGLAGLAGLAWLFFAPPWGIEIRLRSRVRGGAWTVHDPFRTTFRNARRVRTTIPGTFLEVRRQFGPGWRVAVTRTDTGVSRTLAPSRMVALPAETADASLEVEWIR